MPATGVVSSRSAFASATAQPVDELDPIFGRTVIESAPQGVAAARAERANRAARAPAANTEAATQAADTAPGLTRRRGRIALVPILIVAAVGGGFFVYRLQSDAGSSSQVQALSPKRTTGATVTAIGAAAAPLTSPATGMIKPALQSRELAPTTAIVPESTPTETAPAADPASALANPTPAASVAPPAPKAAAQPHRTAGAAAAAAPPNRAVTVRTQPKQPCTPNLAALALCSPD